MKAIQFQFHSPKTAVVDVPTPSVADDEVLVKVLYSALDTAHEAVVYRGISGYFIHSNNKKAPLYLGYHFSGTVEETGSEATTDFPKGSQVFGFLQYEASQKQGAFAEYVTVKKDALAIKPTSVPHPIAAASTTESLTALQAIRDNGGLKKGSSILINGAAGGVGSAAVQIAKALGAQVTAVCSAPDVDRVKSWGADRVINRTAEPTFVQNLAAESDRFDVIFDVPAMLPSAAMQLLRPEGVIVYVTPAWTMLWNKIKAIFSKKRVAFVECCSKKSDLELLGQWLENDTVKIPIDSTFKVSEIEAAVEKQNGKKKGRVVVQVENGWN
eukprot:scaffold770_cov109-Cylindrotheca_fusiformis.AAC.14